MRGGMLFICVVVACYGLLSLLTYALADADTETEQGRLSWGRIGE